MTQSFLYMRNKSTTHSQVAVFKELDMQLVQIGADFGVDEDSAILASQYNRVIHWENDLFAVNGDNIFRYDVAANSGIWEVFHTFLNPQTANKTYRAGLTPCSVDGSGVLVTSYAQNFASHTYVTIDKDLNVVEGVNTPTFVNNWDNVGHNYAAQAISYRNQLIFCWKASNLQFVSYDLKTKTQTILGTPHSIYRPNNQMCVFRDSVYIAVNNRGVGGTRNLRLWRLVGTSFQNLGDLSAIQADNSAEDANGGGALVAINDKLYCFSSHSNVGTGWRLYEITIDSQGALVSSVPITAAVLPAALQGQGGNEGSTGCIRTDAITDPLNPTYEFLQYQNNTEGTSVNLWRWDSAPTGVMNFVDAGLDARRFTMINSNLGTGGGRIWSGSGTLNVSQPCLSLNLNGLDIDAEFTLYGSNTAGVALELYFDKEGEVCSTRGTVVSTTHGSIVGNRVIGLTADNATKVTVGWGAVTDGIQPGDNPTLAARVFIP